METNGSGENQSGLCPCARHAGRGWQRGSACWGGGADGLGPGHAGVRGGGGGFSAGPPTEHSTRDCTYFGRTAKAVGGGSLK